MFGILNEQNDVTGRSRIKILEYFCHCSVFLPIPFCTGSVCFFFLFFERGIILYHLLLTDFV